MKGNGIITTSTQEAHRSRIKRSFHRRTRAMRVMVDTVLPMRVMTSIEIRTVSCQGT